MKNLSKLLILFLLFANGPANACSCGKYTFEEAYKNTDHVFVGKVVKNTNGLLSLLQGKSSISKIEVTKIWKGRSLNEFEVKVPLIRSNCNLRLKEGTSYLIFLSGNKPYRVMLCSGSRDLNKVSKEWLKKLDKLL